MEGLAVGRVDGLAEGQGYIGGRRGTKRPRPCVSSPPLLQKAVVAGKL